MKYKYLIISVFITFSSAIYLPNALHDRQTPDHLGVKGINSPIKNYNFKLAVIDSLMESRTLHFGDFDEFLKQIEGQQYDYEQEGHILSKKAYNFFKDYPLSEENLLSIEELYFDGGLEIYSYIFPFWGGETGDFDIESLKDLRQLPNLRVFEANSMLNDGDLSPLKSLVKLEELGLGFLPVVWQNMDVLLELPELKNITIFKINITTEKHRHVLEKLKERGVIISVY